MNVLIKDSNVIKSSSPAIYNYYDPSTESYIPTPVYLGGDVFGGVVRYPNGNADNNEVVIDNSTIAGDVYGAYAESEPIVGLDYDEHGDVLEGFRPNYTTNNTTVKIINGSVVNGTVSGGYGPYAISGNKVEVDASTVSEVYGATPHFTLYNPDNTTQTSAINNEVLIHNGSNVGTAYTAGGYSVNAIGNKFTLDNSTVSSGLLYSAYVLLDFRENNTIPINADVSSNSLTIKNIGSSTIYEIGAGLNLSGKANQNTLSLVSVSGLTVSRPILSFGLLPVSSLETNNLFALKDLNGVVVPDNNFNASYGFVYGGASVDFTSQVNSMPNPSGGVLPDDAGVTPAEEIIGNGGVQSDKNIVQISNSSINANIIGGFSGEFRFVNYTNWSENSGDFIKTVTTKVGNEIIVTNYVCDGNGQNCSAGTEVSRDNADAVDSKFTASNNTVILENVNFDGTIYGGYVAGADLSIGNVETANNIVVIRGNTTLSNSSLVFGGNAYLGRTTNRLIFDHVAGAGNTYITYNNPNQFQNFNSTWQINADLDTRIDFRLNNVDAIVNVDNTNLQEGSATIIKTQTASDLSNIEQNGEVVDLIDTSVGLSRDKLGIYSYKLVGTKEDATTVGWVLSILRDSNNVEIYGQLPLVGLALASEGPEMLTKALNYAWQSQLDSSAFFDAGYHHTRYHTGSGFDLNSGIMQAGFWKKFNEEWLGGFFVKYSAGTYETYPIKASGNVNAFGGGVMTSYRYSQSGRIEANVEIGYLDLEFNSNQLTSSLRSKGAYYGALFGIAEDISSDWSLYTNLQYLRKGKDSVTDNLSQSVSYDAMQSIAWRVGTEVSFPNLSFEGIVPSLGASGIYEFDGKSKINVADTPNEEASMRGFSGRGEIALSYDSENGPFPLISKLTLFGQAGKRSGFGGELNFSFKF